jgi:hypothetical protein
MAFDWLRFLVRFAEIRNLLVERRLALLSLLTALGGQALPANVEGAGNRFAALTARPGRSLCVGRGRFFRFHDFADRLLVAFVRSDRLSLGCPGRTKWRPWFPFNTRPRHHTVRHFLPDTATVPADLAVVADLLRAFPAHPHGITSATRKAG